MMPSPRSSFLTWVRLAFSLEALIVSCSLSLFLAAGVLSESVIREGDDDWLWLMFPVGGSIGLFLGIRYRNTIWIHVVSVVIALCVVALLAQLWIWSTRETSGMREGFGKLFSLVAFVVVVVTAPIAFDPRESGH